MTLILAYVMIWMLPQLGGTHNYWQNGYGSSYAPPLLSPETAPFEKVKYDSTSTSSRSSYYGPDAEIYCYSATLSAFAKSSMQLPQSLTDSTCSHYLGMADHDLNIKLYQKAYGEYQNYFEYCAASDSNSWKQFTGIGGANYFRSDDLTRFSMYREWLKKVLYYNLDERYYCADAGQILQTFIWFDSIRGKDYNGAIAVAKYLLESHKCSMDSEYLITNIDGSREAQIQHYRDTVHDSLATPIDTTLPSLEDLDLGILRGQNKVAGGATIPKIGELIATRNPFTDALELKYKLDKSAMIRIDIYDLLGKSVYSEGQGFKPEGEHLLSLPTKEWGLGSYYVRLSTPSGEVKTVKVIKE